MKKIISTITTGVIGTFLMVTPALAQNTVPGIATTDTINLKTLLGNIINVIFGIAGALAVIYLVYGGIVYITGGAKGADTGKQLIINAITGIAIVSLSYAIIKLVTNFLGGSTFF